VADPAETDGIIDLLLSEEIDQNWWTTYGSFRGFVISMGLDISKPHVWHKTTYVGSSHEEVKTYIYTMKRIHGEPL